MLLSSPNFIGFDSPQNGDGYTGVQGTILRKSNCTILCISSMMYYIWWGLMDYSMSDRAFLISLVNNS